MMTAKAVNEIRLVMRMSSVNITLDCLRRTLYNFVFARAHSGKFIIQLGVSLHGREPNIRKIHACLECFGLEPDEGPLVSGPFAPYSTTKRSKTYSDVVERLLDDGTAYRCFCCMQQLKQVQHTTATSSAAASVSTSDPGLSSLEAISVCMDNCSMLNRRQSRQMADDGLAHVVRLKAPHKSVVEYTDARYGSLLARLSSHEHLLLRPDLRHSSSLRHELRPTSLLATVVDNHTLCASHQIIASSADFRQLALHSALNWTPPVFVQVGELKLRSGHHILRSGVARRSFLRIYKHLPPLLVLNKLIAGRGLANYDRTHRYTLDQLVHSFSIQALPNSSLNLDTDKLFKPQRNELSNIKKVRDDEKLSPDDQFDSDQLDEELFDALYVGGLKEPNAKL